MGKAWVAYVAIAAVTAASAYVAYESQRKQASMQKDAVEAAAEQERKEVIARQEAEKRRQAAMQAQIDIEREQHAFEMEILDENIATLKSTQKLMAAAGMDIESGSALAIRKDTEHQATREKGQLDRSLEIAIDRIQRDITESEIASEEVAQVGAYNISQRLREAGMYKQRASAAKTMGYLRTGSSLMSGYSAYRTDKKMGTGFFA